MRALIPLVLLVAAGAVGYWLGLRDRRAAVATAYELVLPVLRATRALLSADPAAPSYGATKAVVQHELDVYESEIRVL